MLIRDFMTSYGVSTQEMAEALKQVTWPPISEFDICLIDLNPSLNWFQKWKLKRQIRKNIKEATRDGK